MDILPPQITALAPPLTPSPDKRLLPTLAIVMKGYPRLSETFIAQELLSLQRRGLTFEIWSLREATDGRRHGLHDAITAPVRYLPEYLYRAPRRIIRAWWRMRTRPGYAAARQCWLRDLVRDPTPNRIRRFGQALVLADELPPETAHLYVHFLHTPASVTRYAAVIRGLSWSCSAHAKDIYTIASWDAGEKLQDMAWLVTCTAANVAHLRALIPAATDKVHLQYHGLDGTRFGVVPRSSSPADGTGPTPVRILSIGRAVPKKGYDQLLQALAGLPTALNWRFEHIGGGDGLAALKAQATALGLSQRITWHGAATQDEVLERLRASDLFVLASRIADDGDRDGLPNVLMEAQSQGLACISTAVSAIPELIQDGKTGLLVAPGNVAALCTGLARLIGDPGLRQSLGAAGNARVRAAFAHDRTIDTLVDLLGPHLGQQREPQLGPQLTARQPARDT
jgi:glycosyltransferase involved in cell wall biosynthesis